MDQTKGLSGKEKNGNNAQPYQGLFKRELQQLVNDQRHQGEGQEDDQVIQNHPQPKDIQQVCTHAGFG